MAQNNQPSGWVGWVYFAGILMFISGLFQVFLGIMALVNNTVYVVTEKSLTAFNFTAWGWIHIILGVVLVTAAASVFSGRWWGRLVGSVIAGLAILENLIFLPAYPIWGIAAIALSATVMYALLVKGDEARLR